MGAVHCAEGHSLLPWEGEMPCPESGVQVRVQSMNFLISDVLQSLEKVHLVLLGHCWDLDKEDWLLGTNTGLWTWQARFRSSDGGEGVPRMSPI